MNRPEQSSGGYKRMAFYKQAEIIYDFTVEFCQRYIKSRRTIDQMEQAARSGKQNIAEGYMMKSVATKLKLLGVARASLEELLNDYGDFLRQKNLNQWDYKEPRANAIRRIAYKDYKNYNDYKSYLNHPESAANAMICLINQTNMLLDKKIRWTEEAFEKEGGYNEKLFKRRMNYRNKKIIEN